MEIINPDTTAGENARSCGSDIFAPPHPCYDGGGSSGCIGFSVYEEPCFDFY